MTSANLDQNVDRALSAYNSLSVDDKLAFLWYVYKDMGDSVTPAAPGAAGADISGGLFNQVKEKSFEEQLDIQRKLISGQDSLISREYGSLSANTKLLFWYQLAQGMDEGTIVPMPDDYKASGSVEQLLPQIESLDSEQQITLLRNAVVNAGTEPKQGADI
ncbi:orange carotenoid protein N-terminal domain-containing protein [Myxosarcina sp. GI1]|uniref:orange carotenoid protein N-terminal domain-containing protein n=1 Tax=Myxosarcina sp. GI1 TaxID=1541065 RepID=UPI00055EDFBC|nr:orange carotenoid protein N-terminal domain-containing protein [Myxosarcina sp. GI1]